jgi:hypothetical protein
MIAVMRLRVTAFVAILFTLVVSPAGAAKRAVVREIDGAIGPAIVDYVVREIDAGSPSLSGDAVRHCRGAQLHHRVSLPDRSGASLLGLGGADRLTEGRLRPRQIAPPSRNSVAKRFERGVANVMWSRQARGCRLRRERDLYDNSVTTIPALLGAKTCE